MAITAAQVKQLREITGSGMMDCKKALTATNGDMDAAVEFLRKNGQAKAEKKASRIAAEGICLIATEGNQKAAVVEVNSETDFVAQNEKFRTYVAKVAAPDQGLLSRRGCEGPGGGSARQRGRKGGGRKDRSLYDSAFFA